jgi:hypothetical protein
MLKARNMGFLKFYNWQMLCWVVMSLFAKQRLLKFSFNKLWTFYITGDLT